LQGGGTTDMSLHRRFGNGMFKYLVRLLFGSQYSDLCYGYNAFWVETVQLLNLNGDGFEIETMMNVRALQAGLRIAEVPSYEAPRVNGIGRLRTIPDGWRVLKTIWHEWRHPVVDKSNASQRLIDRYGVRPRAELTDEPVALAERAALTLVPDAISRAVPASEHQGL
jgi:hypothetical protein